MANGPWGLIVRVAAGEAAQQSLSRILVPLCCIHPLWARGMEAVAARAHLASWERGKS
jgi:hypothetical protein